MNSFFSGNSMKHNQPDFITPLRNLTVEVGRNATFECFVTVANTESTKYLRKNVV